MSASEDMCGKLFGEGDTELYRMKSVSIKNVEWVISNACLKDKQVGEYLTSPTFRAFNAGWQMKMYPRGIDKECQNHVSFFLQLKYGSMRDETKIMLSIEDDGLSIAGNVAYTSAIKAANNTYGIKKFFKYDILVQYINNNDDGISSFEFTIISENRSIYQPLNFDTVLNNQNYSDVKFIVEGKDIHAHKVLLANKSNVFAAMFEHKMKENLEGIVEIDDVEYDVMLAMFSYIYTGIIKDIEKIAKPLLIAADKYAIVDLKESCGEYLEQHLNIENVKDCLDLAVLYNVMSLKRQAVDFIKSNASKISQTDVKLMMESHPDIMVEVIYYLSQQALSILSK